MSSNASKSISLQLKSLNQIENSCETLLALWLSCSAIERDRQFADTQTAADMVGVSPRTIRFWIESGCIKAVKIAVKYHIYKESLESFVLAQALKDQ